MRKIIWLILLCSSLLLCGCQSMAPEEDSLPEYASVSDLNAAAEGLAEKGDYTEALRQYAEAMKTNPLDITAILGAAKCQIILKNYAVAATNLEAALQINPKDPQIYDLYADLSRESGDISYARTAISLAKVNQVESFLNRIPAAPEVSIPAGRYDSALEVTVKAPENTEIFVTENTGNGVRSYLYSEPISIRRGTTTLEVYCLKDGIPSEKEGFSYTCEYPPVEIRFSDPVIEQIVRTSLGKESDPVTDVDCEGVTTINAYNYQQMANLDWDSYSSLSVKSFEDFALFPNLQVLELGEIPVTDVTDLSPLRACKESLYQLSFSDMDLNDLSVLSEFSNLEYISLRYCGIQDVSPLRNNSNLQILYIEGNPVSDLSFIKGLDHLKYLHFSAYQLKDLSTLREVKNLTDLIIYDCHDRDLSPLGELNNLQSLYLSDLDNYDQYEIFKSLTNLRILYLYTDQYTSMPAEIYEELQTSLPGCQIYTYL